MEKQKAIFLDRDGVVCKEKGIVASIDQLEIFSFAKEAVDILKDKDFKVFIVTNQSAVARGVLAEEELEKIHSKLLRETNIDKIYYCPHLPPDSDDVLPYRINCGCRKPKPGMILTAAMENNIELSGSYIVGDTLRDILAGKGAGVKTVFVKSGHAIEQEELKQADFVFEDLLEFAQWANEN